MHHIPRFKNMEKNRVSYRNRIVEKFTLRILAIQRRPITFPSYFSLYLANLLSFQIQPLDQPNLT